MVWAGAPASGSDVRTVPAATPTPPTPKDKEEQMPWGSWINDLPTEFFLVVHITAFALGAGFAWLAFKRELALLGSAFSLFAAAELVYMTYHVDWTVFLFAHTIAEVLDLAAFVLVFAAGVYSAVRRQGLNTVEVNR
jgi:hypothetical protein